MKFSLVATELRNACKAALALIRQESTRIYGSVANIEIKNNTATLIATDGFGLIYYPVRTVDTVVDTVINLPYAAVAAIAKFKGGALDSVVIDTDTGECTLGSRVNGTVVFWLSTFTFPNTNNIVAEKVATALPNAILFNPDYMTVAKIFPKSKKRVPVKLIIRENRLYEFTDGNIRYFVVGVNEAA